MNFKDLRNMDKEDLLGLMGLETKSSTAGYVAGTLGTLPACCARAASGHAAATPPSARTSSRRPMGIAM